MHRCPKCDIIRCQNGYDRASQMPLSYPCAVRWFVLNMLLADGVFHIFDKALDALFLAAWTDH
jgi:hypothetical protein